MPSAFLNAGILLYFAVKAGSRIPLMDKRKANTVPPEIHDEPGMAERLPARATEGAQHAAETPDCTDAEG
jgi:hypothetical protein